MVLLLRLGFGPTLLIGRQNYVNFSEFDVKHLEKRPNMENSIARRWPERYLWAVKNALLILFIALLSIPFAGCRKELEPNNAGASLRFSTDTVFLDTVFTTIGSSTRLLKVFNPGNNLITTDVSLGRGQSSYFRLNVNGISGKAVSDVEILPQDSIYVFIEVTADVMGAPDLLYTDSILFQTGGTLQDVQLVTLAKDAYFHLPNQVVQGIPYSILPCNSVWVNDKPHVVYGYAVVDSGCVLTLQPGAEVRFHAGSGLWIASGGSPQMDPGAVGDYANPILLAGDRLEPSYKDVAGQWGGVLGGIFLQGGSTNNLIRNALIKNSTIAIRADSTLVPNLVIENTRVYNSSRVGLFGGYAHLEAENLVIGSAGLYTAYLLGGSYQFRHCTFAGYWSQGSRSTPALGIANFFEDADGVQRVRNIQTAYFGNCIVYGQAQTEVAVLKAQNTTIPFFFNAGLLKLDPNPDDNSYDVNDPAFFNGVILNQDVLFTDPFFNLYSLDSLSPAVGAGQATDAGLVPFDIQGNPRPAAPDLGAYQR